MSENAYITPSLTHIIIIDNNSEIWNINLIVREFFFENTSFDSFDLLTNPNSIKKNTIIPAFPKNSEDIIYMIIKIKGSAALVEINLKNKEVYLYNLHYKLKITELEY